MLNYLGIKKNEIPIFARKWMQLENTMLSEIKPQPKRQVSHLLVVVVNINTEYKNYMNISFATQF